MEIEPADFDWTHATDDVVALYAADGVPEAVEEARRRWPAAEAGTASPNSRKPMSQETHEPGNLRPAAARSPHSTA